jgi:hypothetical protein
MQYCHTGEVSRNDVFGRSVTLSRNHVSTSFGMTIFGWFVRYALVILILVAGPLTTLSAQTAAPFHYPLNLGDRWLFGKEMVKAMKETTTVAGAKYIVLQPTVASLGETRYERVDSGKVFRLNLATKQEELWYDFTVAEKETMSIIHRPTYTLAITKGSIIEDSTYGRPRRQCWVKVDRVGSSQDDDHVIIDSIGLSWYDFNSISGTPVFLTGAIINSRLTHQVPVTSFTLPMQKGNRWTSSKGSVMIDTSVVMPNGKLYYHFTGSVFGGGFGEGYYRQEHGMLLRYDGIGVAETVVLAPNVPDGDIYEMLTVSGNRLLLIRSLGTVKSTIFGKERQVFRYSTSIKGMMDSEGYISCADGFGFTAFGDWQTSFPVTYAIVNGVTYGVASAGEGTPAVPLLSQLEQNFPNPFNPITTVRFAVATESDVTLTVHSVLGEQVGSLTSGRLSPGTYERDFNGSGLASGIYLCRLTAVPRNGAAPSLSVNRMVLVK